MKREKTNRDIESKHVIVGTGSGNFIHTDIACMHPLAVQPVRRAKKTKRAPRRPRSPPSDKV